MSVGWFCPESKHCVIAIAVNPATAEGGVEGCGGFDDAGFSDDGSDGARWAREEVRDEC